MNNTELDKLLKSAPAPERPPDFWEQFPKRISAKLHWHARHDQTTQDAPRRAFPFAWAMGAAAFCCCAVFLGLILRRGDGDTPRESDAQLAQVQKCHREIEAMFPHQVQAIVFDEAGSRIVLAEKANVPESTPLYLRICGPHGCQQVVTFSGQQIRLNGDNWDVLTDASGNVLLVGRHFVWSSASPVRLLGEYRVETRSLGTSS